MDTKVLDSLT